MRLITAHKILIGSAIVFFLFFGGFELRSYAQRHALVDLVSAVFGVAVAVGFGLYFYRLHTRGSTGS